MFGWVDTCYYAWEHMTVRSKLSFSYHVVKRMHIITALMCLNVQGHDVYVACKLAMQSSSSQAAQPHLTTSIYTPTTSG